MHEYLWALGRTKYPEPRDIGAGLIFKCFQHGVVVCLLEMLGLKTLFLRNQGARK